MKPTKRIFSLANEEILYSMLVKKKILRIDSMGRIWRKHERFGGKEMRAECIFTNPIKGQSQSQIKQHIKEEKIWIVCTSSRLVWFHFHGRIPHMKVVIAKDGDKTNTHPSNLYLGTQRQACLARYQRAA